MGLREDVHLGKNIRAVGHDAGQPNKGGCGSILASKQEVHDGVRHGCICGVLRVRQPSRFSFGHFLQAALRPEVHQAAGFAPALDDRTLTQASDQHAKGSTSCCVFDWATDILDAVTSCTEDQLSPVLKRLRVPLGVRETGAIPAYSACCGQRPF